ncbi:MAG TPA: MmcB family DNA repair protein [Alphaproteobacteria bacterium]|nr:MmcB family DNA repair protein [Alphaproteobacteria bacterium]
MLDVVSSDRPVALRLCRGVRRMLWSLGYATLAEFPLANGRRADILGITRGSEIVIVEIKSSIADFRSDQKWPEYREFCDSFFFAVDDAFPVELIPDDCGLILADAFGAEIVRGSSVERLAGARRKALISAFGQLAAGRLHRIEDPMLGSS